MTDIDNEMMGNLSDDACDTIRASSPEIIVKVIQRDRRIKYATIIGGVIISMVVVINSIATSNGNGYFWTILMWVVIFNVLRRRNHLLDIMILSTYPGMIDNIKVRNKNPDIIEPDN